MRRGHVVVVGGAGVGLVFRGRVPEPGESVFADDMRIMAGGKASNQAIGAAHLGAACEILTALGDDGFAEVPKSVWREHGVGISGLVLIPATSTMIGAVLVDPAGENRITIAMGALGLMSASHIIECEDIIASADVCLVSLEIPPEPAIAAMTLARRHGVVTILNPAPAPPGASNRALCELADFVTPNLSEAIEMTGRSGDPEDVSSALLALGPREVVMTLGRDGVIHRTNDLVERVPAVAVPNAIDTSGAGDAFNAAFAVALARGLTVRYAITAGCEAGARIVQGPGFVDALYTWEGFEVA